MKAFSHDTYHLIITLIVVTLYIPYHTCSNILAIFPTPAKSHQIIFDTILVELYERGHNLTVVTQFPETLQSYKGINLLNIKGSFHYNTTIEDIYKLSENNIKRVHINFIDHYHFVNNIFIHDNMKPVWNMESQYDLIITEMFVTDAFLIVPYLYNVPYVSISTSMPQPQHSDRLGLPDNPSYVPTYVSAFSSEMSFSERVINTFVYFYYRWYHEKESHVIANAIIQKHFPRKKIPKIQDLLSTSSVTLLNTHPAINPARPLSPNVVEIGGIHIKPAKKLSTDLEKFMNESEHGVIYFSMGSLLKTSSLSPELRDSFLGAFSKLPQRVLWKFEDADNPIFKQHSNIKALSWMPQRDIFAHPNMKVFIGHGGLLGITEAIYEGVPVLGIPCFGDQWTNIKGLESLKVGKLLPYREISEYTILEGVKTLLLAEYKRNAEELQRRFRDRPQPPLDVATYWIEYVIRHSGARHLQPRSVQLAWYQYFLIDVAVAVAAALILLIWMTKFLISYLLRRKYKKTEKQTDCLGWWDFKISINRNQYKQKSEKLY